MLAIVISAEAWTHFTGFLLAEPVDHHCLEATSLDETDLYELDLSAVTWVDASEGPASDLVQTASLPGGLSRFAFPTAK